MPLAGHREPHQKVSTKLGRCLNRKHSRLSDAGRFSPSNFIGHIHPQIVARNALFDQMSNQIQLSHIPQTQVSVRLFITELQAAKERPLYAPESKTQIFGLRTNKDRPERTALK